MTASHWCIIWYQVHNDGEHMQSFIIAEPHQYLQIISIVSLPCALIQAVSLYHRWYQLCKSIVFHKITKDVVADEFNQPLGSTEQFNWHVVKVYFVFAALV